MPLLFCVKQWYNTLCICMPGEEKPVVDSRINSVRIYRTMHTSLCRNEDCDEETYQAQGQSEELYVLAIDINDTSGDHEYPIVLDKQRSRSDGIGIYGDLFHFCGVCL